MRAPLLLAGVALFIAGCGLLERQPSALDRRLEAAKGQHVDYLTKAWGAADSIADVQDGKVYKWLKPWTWAGVDLHQRAYTVAHVCTVVVITDPAGIVSGHRYWDC